MCSKLTIKSPKRRLRRHDVFLIDCQQILYILSGVPIVDFEQVNAGWTETLRYKLPIY